MCVSLSAVLFLSVEMRQETCIICNQYHSLMCLRSPSQPIMDLFWCSPHLVGLLMVTEWGQLVSPGKKQVERWDLSFTCQEASIVCTWHGVHMPCMLFSRGPFLRGINTPEYCRWWTKESWRTCFFQVVLSLYPIMQHKEWPCCFEPRWKAFWGGEDLNS